MSELDQEARRLLDLAREARTPSAEDRARVRLKLAAVAGIGAPPQAPAPAPAPVEAPAVVAPRRAAAGRLFGSAASLWILGGVCAASAMVGGLVGATVASTAPVESAVTATGAAVLRRATPPRRAPAVGEVLESAAPPEAEPAPVAPPEVTKSASARPTPPPRRPGRPRKAAPAGDSLVAELTLLHRARADWQRGDAVSALSLLERHRRRFADSEVAAEREALRVLCLCDLGHIPRARRLAKRWLRTAPQSPLRAAVAGSCAFE